MARASSRAVSLVALVILLGACGSDAPDESVDETPWEEPVPGTVAVTEWRDDGQPVAPFGPDGPGWESPEEIVSAMAGALASGSDVGVEGRVVERLETGTVIGWIRIDVDDEPVTAGDIRLEMRASAARWAVVRTESREHCTRQLVGGECG